MAKVFESSVNKGFLTENDVLIQMKKLKIPEFRSVSVALDFCEFLMRKSFKTYP
jgi:hypothetical protein